MGRGRLLLLGRREGVVPAVIKGFKLNVLLFLSPPLILVLGALVAVVRSTNAAALFPLRLLAVFYTDCSAGSLPCSW